jgi:hypothetical protein
MSLTRKKGDQILIELRSIMKTINVDDIHYRTYDSQVRIVQEIDKWCLKYSCSEFIIWMIKMMLIAKHAYLYTDAIKE